MSESQYNKKALEEVIKLADEKTNQIDEYFVKQEDDFTEFIRNNDETMKDISVYFNSLQKQLEKWKLTFSQEVQQDTSLCESNYEKQRNKVTEFVEKLKDCRDQAARLISSSQVSNCDHVYSIHNLIYSIDEQLKDFEKLMNQCMALKFVGRLNIDGFDKNEIGNLEKLADFSNAEILPIKLPKIKLGQLFFINFRISKRYCEASKKYISFSVTKSEVRIKVGSYLQDNKDGTFTLSFPITAIIPHTVSIFFLGEHIRNSPYTILFKVGNPQTLATNNGPNNGHIVDDKDMSKLKY